MNRDQCQKLFKLSNSLACIKAIKKCTQEPKATEITANVAESRDYKRPDKAAKPAKQTRNMKTDGAEA